VVMSALRRLSWGVLVLLSACFGSSGSAPSSPPANFVVTAGDTNVVVSWDQAAVPGATYYLYYKAGPEVAVREINATALYGVNSPLLLSGLTNGQQYSFVMNYANGGGPAGPSTPVVQATPRPVSAWVPGTALGAADLNAIAFEGSYLATVGNGGALYVAPYSLANGAAPAWAAPRTPVSPAITSNLVSVIFDGVRFWALGSDGVAQYSSDGSGSLWTKAVGTYPVSLAGITLHSLAYGNGAYVAVGSGGTIFRTTSPNLATTPAWTQSTSNTANDLYSVRYLNGAFFALGANGTLLTSADGITWITHISSTTNALRAVAYGGLSNGYVYYIAVGDNGTVTVLNAASGSPGTQQTTWTVQPVAGLGAGDHLNDVTRAFDSRFVAVGANNRTISSGTVVDGVWTVGSTAAGTLYGLVETGAVFYGVGAAGANVVGR
jgi:hypothetical protein